MAKKRKRCSEAISDTDEPLLKSPKQDCGTTTEPDRKRMQTNKILCLIDVEPAATSALTKTNLDNEVCSDIQNPLRQVAYTYQDMLDIIEEYEISTVSKFLQVLDKKYDTSKSLLHWDTLTGIPYLIAGYSRWYCHHSKSRDNSKKVEPPSCTEGMVFKTDMESMPVKRKYKRLQESKKCDCKASIVVSHVVQFPQYQLPENGMSRRQRSRLNKKILSAFRNKNNCLVQEQSYIIQFPAMSDHTGHVVGKEAGLFQPMDKKLILKIGQLVDDGVYEVKKLKSSLEYFVVNELFLGLEPPLKSNRRFFPTDDNLRSHRKRALTKKYSTADLSDNEQKKPFNEQNDDIFVLVDVDDQKVLKT